jgi:tetrahydromethanopterin S-methyltransferase subunit F
MIKKIIAKIKSIFVSSSKKEDCEHIDRTVKTVRYCSDCKLVLDES